MVYVDGAARKSMTRRDSEREGHRGRTSSADAVGDYFVSGV
jgi:hypothetical protein